MSYTHPRRSVSVPQSIPSSASVYPFEMFFMILSSVVVPPDDKDLWPSTSGPVPWSWPAYTLVWGYLLALHFGVFLMEGLCSRTAWLQNLLVYSLYSLVLLVLFLARTVCLVPPGDSKPQGFPFSSVFRPRSTTTRSHVCGSLIFVAWICCCWTWLSISIRKSWCAVNCFWKILCSLYHINVDSG